MVFFPRKIARKLGYVALFIVIVLFLIITADKKEYINLKAYLPLDLLPSFFQPDSDSYVIDISVENCFNFKSKDIACGVPKAGKGEQGNLYQSGEWVKINKDLSLGSSWMKKQFISYKKLKKNAIDIGKISNLESNDAQEVQSIMEEKVVDDYVVVDVAMSNPRKDSKIPGNERVKIPLKVLKSFHSGSEFDDEVYQKLVDAKAKQSGKTEALMADDSILSPEKDTTVSEESKEAEDTEALKKNTKKKPKPKAKAGDTDTKPKANTPEKEYGDDTKVDGNKNKPDAKEEKKSKRAVADSRGDLHIEYRIPSSEELENSGWKYKSHGIWLRYGTSSKKAITGVDVLFGPDSVDPRPNWELIKDAPLSGVATQDGREAYLTIRRGPKVDYKQSKYQPTLKVNEENKFKILQVADLHFSTGVGKCRDPSPPETASRCEADPRTLKFLDKVLKLERPDLVVLTGDQIFGDEAPDSETAIFKALAPFTSRGIPFAVTMGNHDDEGSLNRKEAMAISSKLPYCLSGNGLDEVDGEGNYVLTVQGKNKLPAISMYFLDTHKYSQNPKITPGYDWIKSSQLRWLEQRYASLKKDVDAYSRTTPHNSFAFFHIPLPEYRNSKQPMVGEHREGVTAPKYNSGARDLLSNIGVQVVSVGHDHCNDYCLTDSTKKGLYQETKVQLCYAGGSGEGGYGGYGGYIRRMRVFEIDANEGSVDTWKRAENDPNTIIDKQRLVEKGNII